MDSLVDFVVYNLLPILWVFLLVGYIWFRVMWRMGKVKITFKGDEGSKG